MNIIEISAISVLIVLGVAVIFTLRSRMPRKEVMHLRPRDKRGEAFKVSDETDLALICNMKNGSVNRYIKRGCGWVFNEKGRMVTRFFGMEGTAYTTEAKGNDIFKVPVSKFLKSYWGETFYNQIPEKQRRAVETDVIGITIEPTKIEEEEYELPNLTTEQINDEDDAQMLKKFVQQHREKTTAQDVYRIVIVFVLGFLSAFFVLTKGWI